jgi:hypothetical protein
MKTRASNRFTDAAGTSIRAFLDENIFRIVFSEFFFIWLRFQIKPVAGVLDEP